MRHNLLRHSNKSVPTFFQTSLGISCDKRGSGGFEFRYFWQALQLLTISSKSLSILGQYILDLAFDFVLLISRWPVCRISFISFISVLDMTILVLLKIRLLTTVMSSLKFLGFALWVVLRTICLCQRRNLLRSHIFVETW